MARASADKSGTTASRWKAAEGTHGLARYCFPLWSYEAEAIGLSLFLISSADIHAANPEPAAFPYDADEIDLGRWILREEPAQTKLGGRRAVIDGHAIATRFAPARDGSTRSRTNEDTGSALEKTDILGRFRAYGEEVGCHLKPRFGA